MTDAASPMATEPFDDVQGPFYQRPELDEDSETLTKRKLILMMLLK